MMASNRRITTDSCNPARSAAFGPADKEINQGPEKMQKQNDQHPGNLFAIAQAVVGNGMDQHPNPEGEEEKAEWEQKQAQPESNQIKQCKHNSPFVTTYSTNGSECRSRRKEAVTEKSKIQNSLEPPYVGSYNCKPRS